MAEPSNKLDLDQAADRISKTYWLSIERARELLETMVVRGRVMIIEKWCEKRKEFRYDDLLRDCRENGSRRVQQFRDLLPLSAEQLKAQEIHIFLGLGESAPTILLPVPHSYCVRWGEVDAEMCEQNRRNNNGKIREKTASGAIDDKGEPKTSLARRNNATAIKHRELIDEGYRELVELREKGELPSSKISNKDAFRLLRGISGMTQNKADSALNQFRAQLPQSAILRGRPSKK